VAADRRHDRAPSRARLRAALAAGATVYLPQVHQVLPRVARLMVALRALVFRAPRAECSFLFLVEGRGREGMGLHHDGDVDAFWLQLEGRRTVTLGPPVRRGTPEELDSPGGGPGWRTLDLPPGSLFYMPPRTPHRVICRGRSLALSLTWGARSREARRPGARERALASWDVASGRVADRPRRSRSRLWTLVPAVASRTGRTLWTADGALVVPASARAVARRLPAMPSVDAGAVARAPWLRRLVEHGILADEDLPQVVTPEDPGSLDGWRFA